MKEPIIVSSSQSFGEARSPILATGGSFDIYEWSGSGPDYLHVHYSDDEAWHILEGTLTFKFSDREPLFLCLLEFHMRTMKHMGLSAI